MISGRVPTTVMTLRRFTSDLHGDGVGAFAVEYLVGPEHGDQGVRADVGHVVSPAGNGLDHHRFGSGGANLMGFPGEDVAEPEQRLAGEYQELLGLGVVVVAAAGHA